MKLPHKPLPPARTAQPFVNMVSAALAVALAGGPTLKALAIPAPPDAIVERQKELADAFDREAREKAAQFQASGGWSSFGLSFDAEARAQNKAAQQAALEAQATQAEAGTDALVAKLKGKGAAKRAILKGGSVEEQKAAVAEAAADLKKAVTPLPPPPQPPPPPPLPTPMSIAPSSPAPSKSKVSEDKAAGREEEAEQRKAQADRDQEAKQRKAQALAVRAAAQTEAAALTRDAKKEGAKQVDAAKIEAKAVTDAAKRSADSMRETAADKVERASSGLKDAKAKAQGGEQEVQRLQSAITAKQKELDATFVLDLLKRNDLGQQLSSLSRQSGEAADASAAAQQAADVAARAVATEEAAAERAAAQATQVEREAAQEARGICEAAEQKSEEALAVALKQADGVVSAAERKADALLREPK